MKYLILQVNKHQRWNLKVYFQPGSQLSDEETKNTGLSVTYISKVIHVNPANKDKGFKRAIAHKVDAYTKFS